MALAIDCRRDMEMYKKNSLNCPAILRVSILKTELMVTTLCEYPGRQVEVAKVIVKIKFRIDFPVGFLCVPMCTR